MKKLSLMVALLVTISTAAFAAGGDASGGGNRMLANLLDEARQSLLAAINNKSTDSSLKQDLQKVYEASLDNKLRLEEKNKDLELNGSYVDAINTPSEQKIIFSGPRLKKMPRADRLRLAIHELAGVAKVPDTNFALSKKAIDLSAETISNNGKSIAIEVCKDRMVKVGLDHIIIETYKKHLKHSLQKFLDKTDPAKQIKFIYGDGDVKIEKLFSLGELGSGKFFANYRNLSIPVTVKKANGSEVELELQNRLFSNTIEIDVTTNTLGEAGDCTVEFEILRHSDGEPYGVNLINEYSGKKIWSEANSYIFGTKDNSNRYLTRTQPVSVEEFLKPERQVKAIKATDTNSADEESSVAVAPTQ